VAISGEYVEYETFLDMCKPPMSSCTLVLQRLHFKCGFNTFTTVILPRDTHIPSKWL